MRLHDTRDSYRSAGSLCPTGFGLSGNQLTFVVSPPDDLFHLNAATEADVSTFSLQPGEPLLQHPLDAQDSVPDLLGLALPPPDARRLPRCAPLQPAVRSRVVTTVANSPSRFARSGFSRRPEAAATLRP